MKNTVLCLCLFTFGIISVKSLPQNAWQGQSPYPRKALMFSGYYEKSRLNPRSSYYPEGLMTAFASGDTISTNSYLGNEPYNPVLDETLPEVQEPSDEFPHQQDIHPVLIDGDATESALDQETTPKRTLKHNKPQKPRDEDQDEEDEPTFFPYGKGGRKPSYNAFFPIMIGGYPGSKSNAPEGFNSGSATAIANSFSTGRGGVASSHATSFGDPYLSMLLRRSFSNRKIPSLKEE